MAYAQYAPPQELLNIHNMNRWAPAQGATNEFNLARNQFGDNYLIGVAAFGSTYFGVGGVLFCLFMLINACICLCRTPRFKNWSTYKQRGCCSVLCSNLFGGRLWYFIPLLVLAGLVIGAVVVSPRMGTAVTSAVAQVDALKAVISSTSGTLSKVAEDTSKLNSLARDMKATITTANDPVAARLQVIMDLSLVTKAELVPVSQQLNSVSNSLGSAFQSDDNFNVGSAGKQVNVAAVVCSVLFLVFLIITPFTLIKRHCCATTFRWCNLFMTIVMLLVYIFTGFMIMGAVLGSDFCVAPAPGAINVLSRVPGLDGNTSTAIAYYVQCGLPSPPPKSAMIRELDSAVTVSNDMYKEARDICATVTAPASTYTQATKDYCGVIITKSLPLKAEEIAFGVTASASSVDCSSVWPIWINLLNAFCGQGVYSIALVWILATVVCVLFGLFLLPCGSRLCNKHPGDPVMEVVDPSVYPEAEVAPAKDGPDLPLSYSHQMNMYATAYGVPNTGNAAAGAAGNYA